MIQLLGISNKLIHESGRGNKKGKMTLSITIPNIYRQKLPVNGKRNGPVFFAYSLPSGL
jgi:hypothetical protein